MADASTTGADADEDAVHLGLLDDLIGYAVKRTQVRVFDDFFRSMDDPAITPQRFTALVLIANNPGITQVRLGRAMSIARSGIKVLVDWLQDAGLAERRTSSNDRRTNGLFLTAKGRDRLDTLEQIVRLHDQRISAQLTPDELDVLRRCLPRLAPAGQ